MSLRSHSIALIDALWQRSSCAVMNWNTGVAAVFHSGALVRFTPRCLARLIQFWSLNTRSVSPFFMRLYCAELIPKLTANFASLPAKFCRASAKAASTFFFIS